MAKKGRKKTKALKKKSPEEEKAEIVAILVAKCGKKEEEVIFKPNFFLTKKVGIFRNHPKMGFFRNPH